MSRTPLSFTECADPQAASRVAGCGADAGWDVSRRYVRIVQESEGGMVAFEFAVGEPGLFVEMVMPRGVFEEFCAAQGVAPTHGPEGYGQDGGEPQ